MVIGRPLKRTVTPWDEDSVISPKSGVPPQGVVVLALLLQLGPRGVSPNLCLLRGASLNCALPDGLDSDIDLV